MILKKLNHKIVAVQKTTFELFLKAFLLKSKIQT
jgi:hypothetical protein